MKEFTETENGVCWQIAKQMHSAYTEDDDVRAEIYASWLTNWDKVLEYREQGAHGRNKLAVWAKRTVGKYIADEWSRANPYEAALAGTESNRRRVKENFNMHSKHKTPRTEQLIRMYYLEDVSVSDIMEKLKYPHKAQVVKHIRKFECLWMMYNSESKRERI